MFNDHNDSCWNSHLGTVERGTQLAKSDYDAREARLYEAMQRPARPVVLRIFRVGDALAIDGERLTVTKYQYGVIERQNESGAKVRFPVSHFVLSDGSDATFDELVYLMSEGRLVDLRDEQVKQSA